MRRWDPQIAPIDFTPKEIPTWIVLKAVPPAFFTPKGISWLASQAGQPIKKFVRDGLDVKVCVIKDVDDEPKVSLEVVLAGGEQCTIAIEYPEPRPYTSKTTYVRAAVVKDVVPHSAVYFPKGTSSGNAIKTLAGEEAPESSSMGPIGEGMGNGSKTSLEVEDPPIQQVCSDLSPKHVQETEDGVLVSDDESMEEIVMEEIPK
ncbi:hypothetical protein LINPERPRIM_LOCUS30290 [Linum perenne]